MVINFGPSNVTGAGVTDNFPGVFTGVTFTATQSGGASGFTPSGAGNIGDTVTMPVGSRISYTARGTIRQHRPALQHSHCNRPGRSDRSQPSNNSATDTDTQR